MVVIFFIVLNWLKWLMLIVNSIIWLILLINSFIWLGLATVSVDMAPPIKRQQRIGRIQYIQARIRNIQKLCVNIQTQYANINFLKRIIFDPSLIWVSAILLIIAEIFVNILVVQQVPCKYSYELFDLLFVFHF